MKQTLGAEALPAETRFVRPRDRRAAFDRELPLVEGALTLVASGAAPRVSLVGLDGGLKLARLAKALGRRAGVHVLARSHHSEIAGDQRFDLIVEQDV
jgi:hypothetical protein